MKRMIKQVFLLAGCSYLAYFLILQQGLIGGLMIAGLFLLICLVLFSASIIGAVKGSFKFFKIDSVKESVGLMVCSIVLSIVVATVTIINSFVTFTTGDEHQALDDKVRLFASTLFQVSSQPELLKTEKNGVTYFYSNDNKDEIAKIDEVLLQERERFNQFLGTNDAGGLTVEFHEDYDSLESSYGAEDVAGYYNSGNKSIHLVPTDESWELILVHEYSHYQSHLFSNQHGLPIARIPSWFEEGIADYLADESGGWYDLETTEIIDFHELDSQQDYDNSSTETFDPYLQSFLAVESLVDAHGEELIPELLMSRSTTAFYKSLETMIGMEIEDYEEIFLDKKIAEQNQMMELFDQAYNQLDSKEYAGAEETIGTIKKDGDIYDQDAAEWILVDILLDQKKFVEAAELLERKIAKDTEEFLVDDLVLLAEIYLLIDPEMSLEKAEQAQKIYLKSDSYYFDEELVPVYEKINSSESLTGYRQLIREEWVYNTYVLDHLKEKLNVEYPGEF